MMCTFEGLGQGDDKNVIRQALARPTPDRLLKVAQAMRMGVPHDEIHAYCKIDPWFLARMQEIIDAEARVIAHGSAEDGWQSARVESDGLF